MRMIGRRFQLSARMVPPDSFKPMVPGGLAIRKIAGEEAALDDVGALAGNAFVVIAESAQAGAVLEARVGDDVDDIGGVAQLAQFLERKKTHAGEICFHAQDAVEFDGMADGFMNLQAKLRAFENDGALALRTLRGFMQSESFFGDALRVAGQIERLDEFVAGKLMLAAEAIRDRSASEFRRSRNWWRRCPRRIAF